MSGLHILPVAFVIGHVQSDGGSSRSGAIHVAIAVLLIAAMVYTYTTRQRASTPSWMSRLEGATPAMSFVLGFLLLGVVPTDVFTSFSVGSYVAAEGDGWIHILPFVLLTLAFLAAPALAVAAFGARARVWLPRARDWMNSHSWIVSEVVLGLFVLLSLLNV